MKVKVKHDECIGCGMCIDMCPQVFKYDEAGLSEVISEEVDSGFADAIAEAEQACPVNAIEFE